MSIDATFGVEVYGSSAFGAITDSVPPPPVAANDAVFGIVSLGVVPLGVVAPDVSALRSITDIDGDNSVAVGQTSVTITCAGLDSAPTVQTATLDGEALTITDWNSGSPIVTIPVDIALKWGRTDLELVVTDDTGSVTLNNVTLSAEAGWEYVNFSGTAPSAGTESGYELVQADHSYALLAGDQWIFESETGLSYDVDTLPTVNPPATITSEYRYWNDSAGTLSAKTAYTIAQKPTLTLGSFTAG